MELRSVLAGKGHEVFTIRAADPISLCIRKLNDLRIGALLVLSWSGKLEGIVSERDVLLWASNSEKSEESSVRSIMTPVERLISVSPETTVQQAMEQMTTYRIRHLPVLEGERLVGLVSIGDLVKSLLEDATRENAHLKDYIYGARHSLRA
jgi:CBS domain-containing protein